MHHDAHDDLDLLAARLRAGIPLRGFDGREIPLRDPFARPVEPVRAARALLDSATALLPEVDDDEFLFRTLARAREVERVAGPEADQAAIAARVTAVLVSAAVRASCLAQRPTASPSELNRAILSWFETCQLQGLTLLDGAHASTETRLYA